MHFKLFSIVGLVFTLSLSVGYPLTEAHADEESKILEFPYKGFEIAISDSYKTIEFDKHITCPTTDGVLLWATDYFDKYNVYMRTNTTAHLIVLKESDVRLNKLLNPLSSQIITGTSHFVLDTKVFKTDLFAFIDCRGTTGTIDARIIRDALRNGINAKVAGFSTFKIIIDTIEPLYNWPKIKITLAPCGEINASSNPDIFVCTELVGDLVHKNLVQAFLPIFLHELGHSVLKIWGLPGYDNEDFADEFATFILASVPEGRDGIDAYIQWLEGQDSVTEAIMQLNIGDRHTISLQRARNIRNNLNRSQEIKARWRKLLKDHER